MNEFIQSAKNILISSMNLDSKETVLIVTDDSRLEIAQYFHEAAKLIAKESIILCMKEREVSGQEPPFLVAEAMKMADLVLCPTKFSLTHTHARIEAVKTGTRIATLPSITKDMLVTGAMTADYKQVEIITKKLADLLSQTKKARIEKDGYILHIDIEGRNGIASTGVYRNKGESGNLPSGEAYIAPLENGSYGEMIIDGSMVGIGKLEKPIIIHVQDGKLKKILNGDRKELDILFTNDNNATLGELGIGTNDKAVLCGIILEDEKVMGTVHIAFGTNISFGGIIKADCHMDGVILNPDLYLDDELIIEKGKFLLS